MALEWPNYRRLSVFRVRSNWCHSLSSAAKILRPSVRPSVRLWAAGEWLSGFECEDVCWHRNWELLLSPYSFVRAATLLFRSSSSSRGRKTKQVLDDIKGKGRRMYAIKTSGPCFYLYFCWWWIDAAVAALDPMLCSLTASSSSFSFSSVWCLQREKVAHFPLCSSFTYYQADGQVVCVCVCVCACVSALLCSVYTRAQSKEKSLFLPPPSALPLLPRFC